MRSQHIRARLRKRPFTPIRIFLTDGSHYDVKHPDMVIVMPRELVIGIQNGRGDFPERLAYCDPVHVTRIEPLPVSSRQPAKRKKQ